MGNEVHKRRGVLKLSQPVRQGSVQNWEDMEKVLHHIFFSELMVSPEEHGILLTETPFNPKDNRRILTEMLFEGFNVQAV